MHIQGGGQYVPLSAQKMDNKMKSGCCGLHEEYVALLTTGRGVLIPQRTLEQALVDQIQQRCPNNA